MGQPIFITSVHVVTEPIPAMSMSELASIEFGNDCRFRRANQKRFLGEEVSEQRLRQVHSLRNYRPAVLGDCAAL